MIHVISVIIFCGLMSGVLIIKDEGDKTKHVNVKNPPKNQQEQRQWFLIILFWFTALAGGLFILSTMTNNFAGLNKLLNFFK